MKLTYERGQTTDEDCYERLTLRGEAPEIAVLLEEIPAILSGSLCDALLEFAQSKEAAPTDGP
jgi:hypothetical protein